MEPGDHASTFGGNALACTAGNTVISWLVERETLKSIQEKGEYLKSKLHELKEKYAHITEIRGCGLIQGIQIDIDPKPVMAKCVEKEDQIKHESRAVKTLNGYFDAVLVHADPNLAQLNETFDQFDK